MYPLSLCMSFRVLLTLTDVSHILVCPSQLIEFVHYTRKVAQNKGGRLNVHAVVVSLTSLVVEACEEVMWHVRKSGAVSFVVSYGFNTSAHAA